MKIGTFFATLCILVTVVSKVRGHGGLAYPYIWVDASKLGDKFDGREWIIGCRDDQWKGCEGNSCLKPFTDLTQVLDGNPEQVVRRLSTPRCYWLFFNDQQTWKSGWPDDGSVSDLRQMPREMFSELKYLKGEQFMHYRQTCYDMDLNNPTWKAIYMRRWWCSQPWMEPGMAKITSPCGVSGGNEGYAPLPHAQKAEMYSYPNAPVTTWKAGKPQKVIWHIHANHGGGYSYRLCKTPAEGIKGLTEECFQQMPLEFNSRFSWLLPEKDKKWMQAKLPQSNTGTWPKGSMWRSISNLRWAVNGKTAPKSMQAKRLSVMDYVKVPMDLPKGDYVLSFRWDTERSNQVWNGCSNIKIV